MSAGLLEKGEERGAAVETEFAPEPRYPDLQDRCEGRAEGADGRLHAEQAAHAKLALVRRLIQQRELRGPQIQTNPLGRGVGNAL